MTKTLAETAAAMAAQMTQVKPASDPADPTPDEISAIAREEARQAAVAKAEAMLAPPPDLTEPLKQTLRAVGSESGARTSGMQAAVAVAAGTTIKPTPTGAPAPAPAPVLLEKSPIPVRTGRMRRPRRTVIMGPPGVGKTTLAGDIDGVVFMDLDNGSEQLDLPRYQFRPDDPFRGHVPRALEDVRAGLKVLRDNPKIYKAVAIDQLDRLELLVQRFCLRRDKPTEGRAAGSSSLESYAYGAGKQIVLDEMRAVCAELDAIVSRGMDVVLLAHTMTAKVNNPSGPDYDRCVLKCTPLVAGYIYEWCDEFGYLHFEDSTVKADGKRGKSKGTSTGRRILEFDRTAAWDAKARLPFPKSIKIPSDRPWEFYRQALAAAYSMTPADLRNEIKLELERIGDAELAAKATAAAAATDSVDRLTAFMQDLRRRPALERDTDATTATDSPDEEI